MNEELPSVGYQELADGIFGELSSDQFMKQWVQELLEFGQPARSTSGLIESGHFHAQLAVSVKVLKLAPLSQKWIRGPSKCRFKCSASSC